MKNRPQYTISNFPSDLANDLKETAWVSFDNAKKYLIDIKREQIYAMDLLKAWAFHTESMINLFKVRPWNRHDDLYDKHSIYLNILYKTFVDYCNSHIIKGLDEVDRSIFKGKLNCARSEHRRNLTYDEKYDKIINELLGNFKWFIKTERNNKKIDFTSQKAIVSKWLDSIASTAYMIGAGDKNNRIRLEDIIIHDLQKFILSLLNGTDYNGKIEYDSILDIMFDNVMPHPFNDLDEAALTKLIVHFVYELGTYYGMYLARE